jgi:hypothetical protein
MIPAAIIEKFGLKDQHQLSPDGYPIFIAENLSNNHPTVFFEHVIRRTGKEIGRNQEEQVRITKAGAVNYILLPVPALAEMDFAGLQQLIEEQLRIPG